MEKSFYIDLSGIAHPAPADMPSPSLTTVHTIPGAERTAHAGTGGEAMLQEFDGLFGYINQLDSTTSTSRMLPVHVVRADLHAFYLTQAHAQAELMDASARVIYTLHPERACYCYLPPGLYRLQIPAGHMQLFGFYFRVGIFRQGNERSFRFLHPLIEAHRMQSTHPCASRDFRIGPRTKAHIHHLLQNLRAGQLDNEELILHALKELIKLSKEKIMEEYEMDSAADLLARQVLEWMEEAIHNRGQEFRIEELAQAFDRSQQYIGRAFRERYGRSLQEQRLFLLVQLAKETLLTTHRITTAAYTCGFNNVHYFSNFFKAETGTSPSEFLRRSDMS